MKLALLSTLSLVLVVAVLVAYLDRSRDASHVDDVPDIERKLSVEADKILRGFDLVCGDFHLSATAPVVLPIKFDLDGNRYGIGLGQTVKLTDSASYQFTFVQRDGLLAGYSDYRLLHGLYTPSYDKPEEPKWTKDQAILVGKSFLKVIADQIKINLGDPRARFDQNYENSKYHEGQWTVWWPRVDGEGHFFMEDGVTMLIAEGHSPLSVGIKQTTLYVEEKGDPMTMEEALQRARSKIKLDKFWSEVKSWLP